MEELESFEKRRTRNAVFHTSIVIGVIVLIFMIENLVDYSFYWFGIYPREWHGLQGVLLSPFKHHNFGHLINNMLLLCILLIGFFLHVERKKLYVKLLTISIVCNVWVWIGGRPAWHYGASGIVYGLFFFLLIYSIRFRKKELYLFLLSCLILSAGFFVGLFPYDPSVSYEGHLFGSIAGLMIAVFEKKIPTMKKPVSNINFSRNAEFKYHYEKKRSNDI